MSPTFMDKMSKLRNVKGVSKKKLKAQEYNLRRKMGICYRCTSTDHTQAKCPEKVIKNETRITPENTKKLPPQKTMEKYTEKYEEKDKNMLTSLDVDWDANGKYET